MSETIGLHEDPQGKGRRRSGNGGQTQTSDRLWAWVGPVLPS